MVVSINLFDTNSRVDDLYEELAVRNARTSKVADDLIKVDDMIFNLTQNGSMSKDQKAELEGYINDLLTSANALQATRYPKEVGAVKTSAKFFAISAAGSHISMPYNSADGLLFLICSKVPPHAQPISKIFNLERL